MSVVAWMVASLSLLSAGEAPPAEGGGAAEGTPEVAPRVAVRVVWTTSLQLLEAGAEGFQYPASELGRSAGLVECDAKVVIDAEGRPAPMEGYPKGCPPAFVEATRAGLAALEFRRVGRGAPEPEERAFVRVQFSLDPVPPSDVPVLDRHARFHFPDSPPVPDGLPANCALRLHVASTGEVIAVQPAPAGCPAVFLPGALEEAYRLRFQLPPERPEGGWRFELVVTYDADERALAAQRRRALRLSRRVLAVPAHDGSDLRPRPVPEALPLAGRARLFVFYPSRDLAGLDLDSAVTLASPGIRTRRPDEHFDWPRGLRYTGEEVSCFLTIWYDAEGRPVHVEPEPGRCTAGAEAEAIGGALELRFQPVRVDGEVLPLVRTGLLVRFRPAERGGGRSPTPPSTDTRR